MFFKRSTKLNQSPKILIVAQTPPPFYGQSIMQEYLVNAKWDWCKKIHIRLDFSESIKDVGDFQIIKIFKMIKIVWGLVRERLKGPIDVFFYPPSGPHKIPFYRDMIIITAARLLVRKIIFQFHAGNFDGLLKITNKIEKKIAKSVYKSPDTAIVLLPSLADELTWIFPKSIRIVPNGINDIYYGWNYSRSNSDNCCKILFVGLLSEKKGVFVCLQAANYLKNMSLNFKFVFVGGWFSNTFENEAQQYLKQYELEKYVEFKGIQTGDEKWKTFKESDIFCLPTYETEAMPISIIEAMMMSLPVISTKWRAIPDIVEDEITGCLIPIKNSLALAEKVAYLYHNSTVRIEMGRSGREKYLKEYTIDKHLSRMQDVFKTNI